MIGTTVYMAPEHFQFRDLDEKTDQFSFCVTLFEALYGKRPFREKLLMSWREISPVDCLKFHKGQMFQNGLKVNPKGVISLQG